MPRAEYLTCPETRTVDCFAPFLKFRSDKRAKFLARGIVAYPASSANGVSVAEYDGLYPVTVLMNGAGEIVCDEQGKPVVVILPLTIARTDDKTVEFYPTDQMLSPKRVAGLVDVHKATVHRAVVDGQLPKPTRISSRRVAHRLSDVQD